MADEVLTASTLAVPNTGKPLSWHDVAGAGVLLSCATHRKATALQETAFPLGTSLVATFYSLGVVAKFQVKAALKHRRFHRHGWASANHMHACSFLSQGLLALAACFLAPGMVTKKKKD